mgnify:CR=1 FL=1
MQDVEQFGDFAIQLRLKMMTRPGEQFAICRKAYALLENAFDENGTKLAFPTVQVASREPSEPAARSAGAQASSKPLNPSRVPENLNARLWLRKQHAIADEFATFRQVGTAVVRRSDQFPDRNEACLFDRHALAAGGSTAFQFCG